MYLDKRFGDIPNVDMVSYTLSHQAYLKIFYHAAKHPHKAVNGVLVGKLDGLNAVCINDAIPLLHHWTNLSPMTEIGLSLVSFVLAIILGIPVLITDIL
jgi:Uncharacterised protein family (UPF0172)